MNNSRRAAGLAILVFGMLATMPPLVSAAELQPGGTFIDDDDSVHQSDIEALVALGVARGCSEAGPRFCPDDIVTRAQMAAFLSRSLPLPDGAGGAFVDTAGSLFEADINRVAAAGITVGCDPPANTSFCPDDPVTRGQMAAFMVRAFGLGIGDRERFGDVADSVFQDDIARVAKAGITLGCDPPTNLNYCPHDLITRGQMASFLARALELDPVEVPQRPAVLPIVPREAWSAAQPRGDFIPHVIERLTIHHSGAPASSASGPPIFRGWQNYHFSLGWPDLAYHFIVGRDGVVYEARPTWAAGDTATEYDPTGHFLVVVEGNYQEERLSEAQLEGLTELLAWAAIQFNVSPDTISGHRDHAATTCPGDNLGVFIDDGSLIEQVSELVDLGGVSLIPA